LQIYFSPSKEEKMTQIEFRKGAVDPGCINRGWELIRGNYGLFFGMALVQLIITIVANSVPYIGWIAVQIVVPPLMAGIDFALLVKLRGEQPNFSMMFDNFVRFLPTILVSLIQAIPWFLFSAVTYLFVSLNPSLLEGAGIGASGGDLAQILRQLPFALVGLTIAVSLLSFALGILFFFAIPLIVEHDLSVGDAIKLSVQAAAQNFGGILLLLILEGLLLLAGFLVLCVGFLFVLPVIYAANIVAYRSVFPDAQKSIFNEPPRPDAYGSTYGTAG
jgi:hypothetical protein